MVIFVIDFACIWWRVRLCVEVLFSSLEYTKRLHIGDWCWYIIDATITSYKNRDQLRLFETSLSVSNSCALQTAALGTPVCYGIDFAVSFSDLAEDSIIGVTTAPDPHIAVIVHVS